MCWYRRKSPAAEEKHSLSRRAPRATLSFSRSFRARAEVLWNCALATNRCRQICKTGRDFEVGVRWAFIIYSTFLFTISCFKTCRFRTLRWVHKKIEFLFLCLPWTSVKREKIARWTGFFFHGSTERRKKNLCNAGEELFSIFFMFDSLCAVCAYVPPSPSPCS